MKVFIVDDEPLAIRSIVELLKVNRVDFPYSLLGTTTNPTTAIRQINQLKPDTLFLDVKMPGVTGFGLLDELQYREMNVVFVTAYREFALEAFDMDAVHYLLKPVSPNSFRSCLVKLQKHIDKSKFNLEHLNADTPPLQIAVKALEGYTVLSTAEILFIASDGAYSTIHLKDNSRVTISKNLKQCNQYLPKPLFVRISRSVIINSSVIKAFSLANGGSITLSNGKELLVGKTYQKATIHFLRNKFVDWAE